VARLSTRGNADVARPRAPFAVARSMLPEPGELAIRLAEIGNAFELL
jgi:hypothetical protein